MSQPQEAKERETKRERERACERENERERKIEILRENRREKKRVGETETEAIARKI